MHAAAEQVRVKGVRTAKRPAENLVLLFLLPHAPTNGQGKAVDPGD
jgi:hypothetical protein